MSIFICIISAFFWAAFDLTRKLSLQKINSVNLLLIFTLAQTLIFGSWVFYEIPFLNLKSYIFPGLILILISLFSALLFLKAISFIFYISATALKVSHLKITEKNINHCFGEDKELVRKSFRETIELSLITVLKLKSLFNSKEKTNIAIT